MATAGKVLLVLLYPLLIAAGWVRRLRGDDPLRLTEPSPRTSCWIACPPPPAARSYFSEVGATGNDGSNSWPARSLSGVARLLGRAHRDGRRSPRPSAMPSEVPDEVYTLW